MGTCEALHAIMFAIGGALTGMGFTVILHRFRHHNREK